MAGFLDKGLELGKAARWWENKHEQVAALEEVSLRLDRTIRRMNAIEIEQNPDLREFCCWIGVEPGDLLAYISHAEGRFGCYRLVAAFPWPPDKHDPFVLCLDGPRGQSASEHRYNETLLCLYYGNDPDERRWKPEYGLLRLFDLARRHIACEHIFGMTKNWPVEQAPHGETEPVTPDPSLTLPPLGEPERNDPCNCGSGYKAKYCCWKP